MVAGGLTRRRPRRRLQSPAECRRHGRSRRRRRPPPSPVLRAPPLNPPPPQNDGGVWPSPPTSTVSDAPGMTDTVAVVRPPMPAKPPRGPSTPRHRCAPVATIVIADDAGGHHKGLRTAGKGESRGTGRRQSDREGLRSACSAGRRDRHRAGTTSCGRASTKLGGQRGPAAHVDVGDRDVTAGDRAPWWRRRRNSCPSA